MKKLSEVLKNKVAGLYYGNRLLLPFAADILKAVIEDHIIMDFSATKSGAQYFKHDSFTEIYFFDYKNLSEEISKYETIKLIVVEQGQDPFDFTNHKKLAIHLNDQHKLKIEETNEDILFIE